MSQEIQLINTLPTLSNEGSYVSLAWWAVARVLIVGFCAGTLFGYQVMLWLYRYKIGGV